MGDHANHADIDRQVKTYIVIFITLMALTFVTVAISRIHLPVPTAIALALVVASVKGSLVAAYFMHLVSERKLIWWVLWFTISCFIAVLLLPVVTYLDPITNN
jgi:cytochrome c oxidase subunit IV